MLPQSTNVPTSGVDLRQHQRRSVRRRRRRTLTLFFAASACATSCCASSMSMLGILRLFSCDDVRRSEVTRPVGFVIGEPRPTLYTRRRWPLSPAREGFRLIDNGSTVGMDRDESSLLLPGRGVTASTLITSNGCRLLRGIGDGPLRLLGFGVTASCDMLARVSSRSSVDDGSSRSLLSGVRGGGSGEGVRGPRGRPLSDCVESVLLRLLSSAKPSGCGVTARLLRGESPGISGRSRDARDRTGRGGSSGLR